MYRLGQQDTDMTRLLTASLGEPKLKNLVAQLSIHKTTTGKINDPTTFRTTWADFRGLGSIQEIIDRILY